VCGDRTRLTQAISNLLHNANRYTPVGGRITVSARQEHAEVVLSVRDTGVGIPRAKLDEIFELFAQVDQRSARSREGLGIGLNVARRLIEIHSGRIEAYSEGEGQGSEFIVRLPLREAQGITSNSSMSTAALDHVPRKILIADDNTDAAISLSMLLEGMGHQCRVVHDGPAALEAAEEMRPDAVILDIGMPKLDGYTVARRLAEQPWSGHTLLIALTGWAQEADRRRASDAGFHHHLVKPVETAILREVLSRGVASKDD
jgi:CheY-like chemotaxis protein